MQRFLIQRPKLEQRSRLEQRPKLEQRSKLERTMKYKIEFFNNYYDGPLSGIVNYEGKSRYFAVSSYGFWGVTDSFTDEDDEEWQECWLPRIYKVYDLPRFELLKIQAKNTIFEVWKSTSAKFFGNYTNWFFRLFYKIFKPTYNKPTIDARKHHVIGAFSDDEYWREKNT